MNLPRRVELACWVAAAVVAVVAVIGWRGGGSIGLVGTRPQLTPPPVEWVVPSDTVFAAARTITESDPFRFERRPTAVSYRPELEGVAPPPKPPKPALVLMGLVGRAHGPWAAVLDGAPGRTMPALVHAGDTVGGLRIRRIGRDTVVLDGMDTTWHLTVRRAWQ